MNYTDELYRSLSVNNLPNLWLKERKLEISHALENMRIIVKQLVRNNESNNLHAKYDNENKKKKK